MSGRRQKFRQPLTGTFIIGEGITEQYYFEHLKKIFGFKFTIRPRLFGVTSIADFNRKIKELLQGDVTVICVFDGDVSKRDVQENRKLVSLKHKYAKNVNVVFCESYPSIEYWFLLHFMDTCPNFPNNNAVIRELKKYIPDFEKTERFLREPKWVIEMSLHIGSLKSAIDRAEKYAHQDASYSDIYLSLKNKYNEIVVFSKAKR